MIGSLVLAACSGPQPTASHSRRSETGTSTRAAAPSPARLCRALAREKRDSAPLGPHPTAVSLRSEFQLVERDEAQILAAAPPSIKPDFQALFSVTDRFYSALAAVNYDYAKLPADEARTLASSSAQLAGPSHAIQAYLGHACGGQVPAPTG